MDVIALKRGAHLEPGQAPSSTEVELFTDGLPFLQGNAEFGPSVPNPRFECDSPKKMCEQGDILVSVRAPVGALNLADRRYGIGRGLCAVRPFQFNSRFIWWWIHSQVGFLNSIATGSTYTAITAEDLGNSLVPRFGIDEQRRIADFLDAETSRIDELVTKKRRLVSLLEERVDHAISIRIAESPLVGSSSNKPSIPICRALRKLERAPRTEDVVTAFRDGQVTARSLRRAEGYTESWTDGAQVQGVTRGDVVVHGLDGFAGAIGAAEADGVCSPVYHVCEPRNGGDSDYLGRLLRNLAISGYLELFATSTRERAVDFRNWRRFGRIPTPDIDPSEQREIGNRIREIRPLEAAVERSAELAAERRQALITAAVTGQLDVTTARSGVRVS